jgi:hypothetical protein
MKEENRRAVAHAVSAKSGRGPQTFIYSWSERCHTPFDGAGSGGFDHTTGVHVEETELGLFHHLDGGCHVKLDVASNSFRGFDSASKRRLLAQRQRLRPARSTTGRSTSSSAIRPSRR